MKPLSSNNLPKKSVSKKHRREENTTVTISLPKTQLDRIKALAEADARSVSNYMQRMIEQEISRRTHDPRPS